MDYINCAFSGVTLACLWNLFMSLLYRTCLYSGVAPPTQYSSFPISRCNTCSQFVIFMTNPWWRTTSIVRGVFGYRWYSGHYDVHVFPIRCVNEHVVTPSVFMYMQSPLVSGVSSLWFLLALLCPKKHVLMSNISELKLSPPGSLQLYKIHHLL